MKLNETQAVKSYKEHRDAIPAPKWKTKVGKFLGGALVAGITTFFAIRFGVDPIPWWAYAIGYLIAGRLVKPDVVAGLVKFVVGAIKDIRGAFKNGSA